MLGIALIAISTFVTEISCSISKHLTFNRENRVYAVGFVVNFGAVILMLCLGLLLPKDYFGAGLPGGFVFSLASLPFFIPRLILDIAQSHVTQLALARTERSTFGFLRVITLPLLLVVDLVLGYTLHMPQIIGIILTVVGLLFLFLNHGIKGKGAYLTLFTALNAVATLTLYKYDITHFNSVAAEQSIIGIGILVYFFVLSVFVAKQNPLRLLTKRAYFIQFVAGAIESVAGSFAYMFAPASVITSAKRALSVLWAIAAGDFYFHEKKILLKLICFAFVAVGLVLLLF